jgi:protein gp37
MQKSKIEWCDYTWNPITGCLHGCPYCYAAKIAKRFSNWGFAIGDRKYSDLLHELDRRYNKQGKVEPLPFGFEPTFHKYRLDEPQRLSKPANIFACSMADLFGGWVPDDWIDGVFTACNKAPQNRYLFLTKNPTKMCASISRNTNWAWNNDFWWFGTSVTKATEIERIGELHSDARDFVSIEPILEPIYLGHYIYWVEWVIIGAETGNRKVKVIPKREWIQDIVDQCRAANVPVFLKNSLQGIWGETLIQEFPWWRHV